MPRQRSPERDKAYEIWRDSGGAIALRDIAEQLGVPEKSISGWKVKDKWDKQLDRSTPKNERSTPNDDRSTPKRAGAPRGNKNAVGHGAPRGNRNGVGHGAPRGNKNREVHGLFSKMLPPETLEVVEALEEMSPLEIMWQNITIQYAAILRAQQLMFVQDQDEIRKVLKRVTDGEKSETREWEFQFPWDRHASFLQAQSRAMTTLQNLIRRYEEMLPGSPDSEEQQLRISKLKAEVDALRQTDIVQDKQAYINALQMTAGEVWSDETE